jgi:hypothetical protein
MQQPVFRDVLWAIVEAHDLEVSDVSARAYDGVLAAHPGLSQSRFEEIVELLVRSDHLRRWSGPTDAAGAPLGTGSLMPTAKARLQFAATLGY